MRRAKPTLRRVLCILAGEADACVPFTDNEYWTSNMGYPVKPGTRAHSTPSALRKHPGWTTPTLLCSLRLCVDDRHSPLDELDD
jgi:hypothetical protein